MVAEKHRMMGADDMLADTDERDEQLTRYREAYSCLWHRHRALLLRMKEAVHVEDTAPYLPPPSELRTP